MSRFTSGPASEMATRKYRVAPVEVDDDLMAEPTAFARPELWDEPRIDPSAARTIAMPNVDGYDLLEQIGRGGMGVVYKARHRGLNRIVALKMILNGAQADESDRLRFLQEAQAVAQLQHPNIVPIHHIGLHEETHYFSLEYVDGGTLHQHINGRPQPAEFAARIVEQLADGIHHAHSFGIVHRDLKPANILLAGPREKGQPGESTTPFPSSVPPRSPILTPTPKITDFGLAKRMDSSLRLTMTGMVAGTPSYMAPEQIRTDPNRRVSPASDIYALGAILYEMLTGRPPFLGDSALEIMHRVTSEDPLVPRALQPNVPRDLETICLKCLEKDPNRRYRTSEELAEDLRRYRSGKPILARPVGRFESWVRWAKRNPSVAGTVVGVSALFLLAFFLVSWSYLRAESQRIEAEKQKREERRERYRTNVGLAASSLQMNNSHTARNSLNAAPEEYRDWEWNHFASQFDTAREVVAIDAHASAVSRDGRRLAFATGDGRTELRELPSGRVVASTEPRPDNLVRYLTFSPDGKTLAEGADDGVIRLLDGDTLQVRAGLQKHQRPIFYLEFDPRGRRLLSGGHGDSTLHLWDVETARLTGSCRTQMLTCRFAADGESVVIGRNLGVSSWDGTNEPRSLFELPNCSLIDLAWSADGNYLAASSRHPDNKIYIWERRSGSIIQTLEGHKNSVKMVAFSPNGKRLASASFDQTVRLWDPANGQTVSVMRGHTGHVQLVAFSPDSTQLISGASDGTVRLWDGVNGERIGVLRGHDKLVSNGTFTADGKLIVTRSEDGALRIWDKQWFDSNLFRGHASFVYDVAISPDGRRVASVGWDGMLHIWDAQSGRLAKPIPHEYAIVSSVAFDRDGRRVVTCSRDLDRGRGRMVNVWDAVTGELLGSTRLTGDYYKDSRATYSPTEDRIAVAEATGVIRLFDGHLKEELARYEGHTRIALDVAYRPDGLLLASGSEDKTVRLLDATTLAEVAILTGHEDDVLRVVFSPDGRLLASGSADRTVRIWDVETRQQIAELKHGSPIYGLAFTPDGRRLAAGCADNTIRLWDTDTFKEVAELLGHSSYVHSLTFSPDGTRLFSASGDTTVRVWETLSVQERAARRKAE